MAGFGTTTVVRARAGTSAECRSLTCRRKRNISSSTTSGWPSNTMTAWYIEVTSYTNMHNKILARSGVNTFKIFEQLVHSNNLSRTSTDWSLATCGWKRGTDEFPPLVLDEDTEELDRRSHLVLHLPPSSAESFYSSSAINVLFGAAFLLHDGKHPLLSVRWRKPRCRRQCSFIFFV